jgi:alkylation response protein AidB-like acyl-CoA dehydrogenase
VNPLLADDEAAFLLHDVLHVEALCGWPAFAEHAPEDFDLLLAASRRLAREVLWPAYRGMDHDPPRYEGGRVRVHPAMRSIYLHLVEHGVLTQSRPRSVGGLGVPLTVTALASLYLMAANLGAYAFAGLTTGAAHLVEAFGDEALRALFMVPMYEGRWTGTMALTEPQAGSSLGDVQTKATPRPDGRYLISGAKVFISGGDHDFAENIVHLGPTRPARSCPTTCSARACSTRWAGAASPAWRSASARRATATAGWWARRTGASPTCSR